MCIKLFKFHAHPYFLPMFAAVIPMMPSGNRCGRWLSGCDRTGGYPRFTGKRNIRLVG